jgi:dolichyl-phosphate beta-glucosyltransferase
LQNNIYLSIVIPAYNEEHRLPDTLAQVAAYFEKQTYTYEVLVVENGSLDRTFAVAQAFAGAHPHFRVIREAQSGKGRAVRAGMLAAFGQYRFMCDADLSMPIAELGRFLPPEIEEPQVVIASREAEGAVRFNEPQYRHLGGRFVNDMIRYLVLPGLWDTQCGFKLFRDDIAADLFSFQTLTGWSFDVELLYIAQQRGYEIVELPISWHYRDQSHVKPFKDTLKLFFDLLAIRRNARKGVYDPQV